VNGEPLEHTLQLPEQALTPGNNAIVVRMAAGARPGERLSASTVRLVSASAEGDATVFEVEGYGPNRLTFGDLAREVDVIDEAGEPVDVRIVPDGAFTHVSFEGHGAFTVVLAP
jgi:hypothetical protein